MASAAPPRQPIVIARRSNSVRRNDASTQQDQGKLTVKPTAIQRASMNRLKVVIRRLPPGLTEDKFREILGSDWRVGGERVDWYSFKEGKVTKDVAKPSVPGRAYLNLTRQNYVSQLSNAIREAIFVDAKNTVGDTCLLGPPFLEMATYGRIPNSKPRKDARQGTIDQDSEFMEFLQGLTHPITKPQSIDASEKDISKAGSEIITPLIQYLRDKKANKEKGKDVTSSKSGKQSRQDKESKTVNGDKNNSSKGKNSRDPIGNKTGDKKGSSIYKGEKSGNEPIRVLSKPSSSSSKTSQPNNSTSTKSPLAPSETSISLVPTERKQRKVGAEAKSLLQRDLGLGSGRRGRKGDSNSNSTSSGTPKPRSSRESTSTTTPHKHGESKASAPKSNTQKSAGAQIGAVGDKIDATEKPSSAAQSIASSPQIKGSTPAPTQAFLKHANASQGITESSLQAAMSTFGTVHKVEIDKKKGFGYVDFGDSEALKKAIAASPVKIGHGCVTVMERKEKSGRQEKGTKGTSNMSPQNPAAGGEIDGVTTSVPDSPSSLNAAADGSTATGNASVTSRSGGNRGHRPRGNRGRGPGRNVADKTNLTRRPAAGSSESKAT